MTRKIILKFAFLLFPALAFAQSNSQQIVEARLKLPQKNTLAETIVQIGESFAGLPYTASTLEFASEQLVCNLNEFDCYTFVENVLAISLTKLSKDKTYENYRRTLQSLRYRNGEINGYASRIHYFFDWAKHAEANGLVQDMSPEIGQKVTKKINFMSTHRQFYPAFATDDKVWNEIKMMESNLSGHELFEIPKAKFAANESQIRTGDIIAFTSTVPGLDVNHEGFAVWKNGKLYLMHASLDFKKVIVSTETMGEYLNRIKKHAGVMVLRPI